MSWSCWQKKYSTTNSWNLNNESPNNNNKTNNNSVLPVYEFVIDEIYDAYFDCRKKKRMTESALRFEFNYEHNLHVLWEELRTRQYEIGKSIAFCVTRPKLREVFAADFRDRIVQHLVIRKLEPYFELHLIVDTYNCRKGKGTYFGVLRIKEKIINESQNYTVPCYIMKCDLKGFFMSIDKTILNKNVLSFVDSVYKEKDKEFVKYLISKIILHHPEQNCEKRGDLTLFEKLDPSKSLLKNGGVGLPIGNISSLILANFYLSPLDNFLKSVFAYGRYVDDFVCIDRNKQKLLSYIPIIKRFLKTDLGLCLHPDKIYILEAHKGVKFVGSVIKHGRLYSSARTVGNFYGAIRQYRKDCDLEHYLSRINCYLGFLKNHATYNIRKKYLLLLMSKTINKYVYIYGEYKVVKLKKKYKKKYTTHLRNLKEHGKLARC